MQQRPTFHQLITEGYQLMLPLPMPPGIKRNPLSDIDVVQRPKLGSSPEGDVSRKD